MSEPANQLLSFALVGGLSVAWLATVASTVPGPYLDEYFHVRQAEQYWIGNWHVWDPKITTPPGLYVVSWAWLFVLGAGGIFTADLINKLRSINAIVGIPAISATARYLLDAIQGDELSQPEDTKQQPTKAKAKDGNDPSRGFSAIARNIALFPPLFFFTGLYYTDVVSVLAVLVCYEYFHDRNSFGVVLTGLVSLTFRQNNIFWCAVYLGGLEVVRTLKRNQDRRSLSTYSQIPEILNASWTKGEYYDPSIDFAGVEDYVLCAATIAIAGLVNLPRLLIRLGPYITLLASFGAFIVWNGGVVLGDKSNHVASLHLPQMLYIWPYMAFFSFPAMLPNIIVRLNNIRETKNPLRQLANVFPRPLILLVGIITSAAAIRYNTIIHPFTLADNRHYTFYVFRILRLYPLLKYAAVPVYIGCAWAALTALGSTQTSEKPQAKSSDKGTLASSNSQTALAQHGNRVSFVIVWLVSSALGLVTAPLVEPRYYILPWIIWRLHVPATTIKTGSPYAQTVVGRLVLAGPLMETVWALLINFVTMWIFVHWGFEWKQEPGAVQRFMW